MINPFDQNVKWFDCLVNEANYINRSAADSVAPLGDYLTQVILTFSEISLDEFCHQTNSKNLLCIIKF